MCTVDVVKILKPLFYDNTNDIVVFEKISNFLWYNCRKWHLKDDSTVLYEDLNMDITWALLRMKLACLMKRGISPGNIPQVFSWGGYQSILNPAVLRFLKVGYCPMIEGYGTDFTTVYTVLKHSKMVGDVWNRTMQESSLMWPSSSKQSKFKFSEVFRRICKHRGSFWRITQHTQLPVLLGKKFRFYVSALRNISVYSLMIFITLSFFNDFQ